MDIGKHKDTTNEPNCAHYIITLSRDASCTMQLGNVSDLFWNAYYCCCCWLCAESIKSVPDKKTVRIRGFVRCIHTVPIEKQRFRSCPEKKGENRTKPRFIHTVHSGEIAVLYGFSHGEWIPTVEKNVQRGTAPNCTVGFLICETAPNLTVGFTISENRTDPHRKISDFLKLHRTGT